MSKLLQLLKKGAMPKKELSYGTILSINEKDYKVRVELDSGLKTWVRYNNVLDSPTVGDSVLVGGNKVQFVMQDIEGVVPKTHVIQKV